MFAMHFWFYFTRHTSLNRIFGKFALNNQWMHLALITVNVCFSIFIILYRNKEIFLDWFWISRNSYGSRHSIEMNNNAIEKKETLVWIRKNRIILSHKSFKTKTITDPTGKQKKNRSIGNDKCNLYIWPLLVLFDVKYKKME